MGDQEPRTKLDSKIARDKLLENLEPLWDDLNAAIEATRNKLLANYGRHSNISRNDHNSVTWVAYSVPMPNEASSVEHTLEVRLDRAAQKVVTRISLRYSRGGGHSEADGLPAVYQITPDPEHNVLRFTRDHKHYSAVELAEHELAERLMKMDL